MPGDSASKVRADVEHGQGLTAVAFRRPGRWASALGFAAVLVVVMFAGWFAAIMLAVVGPDNPTFLAAWLAIWVIGGLLFIYVMAWRTFGTERLVAYPDRLMFVRKLLFFERRLELSAGSIGALRWIANDPSRRVTVNRRPILQPAIEIAAGSNIIRCAHGISEAEAQVAIRPLWQRLSVAMKRAAEAA